MSKYIVDMDEYLELLARQMGIEPNKLLYNSKKVYKVDNHEFESDCVLAMQFFSANLNLFIVSEYVISLEFNLNHTLKLNHSEMTSGNIDSYSQFYTQKYPSYTQASKGMEVVLKYSAIKSLLFTMNENIQHKSDYRKMAVILDGGIVCVEPSKVAVSSIINPNRDVLNDINLTPLIEKATGIAHETKNPTI